MANYTELPERHYVDKARRLSLGGRDSDTYFDGETLETLIDELTKLKNNQVWAKTDIGGIYYSFAEGEEPINLPEGNVLIGLHDYMRLVNLDGHADLPGDRGGNGGNLITVPALLTIIKSTPANSVSYMLSEKNNTLLDNDVSYLKNFYFIGYDQVTETIIGDTPLKPSTVANDENGNTILTFSKTLNPDIEIAHLIAGIQFNKNAHGIIASVNGLYQNNTHGGAHLNGNFIVNSGSYVLVNGQRIVNSGGVSAVIGSRIKNSGNYALISGNLHINKKPYVVIGGTGHNTTNGPDGVVAVGFYSDIKSDSQFVIGNGVDNDNRSNLMEVHTDGRATISADPTNNMDVATKQYVDHAIATALQNLQN